jgi:hypothetical protein
LTICVGKLESKSSKLIILSIYTVPTQILVNFKKSNDALKYMYKPKAELLICGDINADYLTEINLGRERTRQRRGGR